MKKSLLCLTIIVTGALSSTTFAAPTRTETGSKGLSKEKDAIERLKENLSKEEMSKFERLEEGEKTQLRSILEKIKRLSSSDTTVEADLALSYLSASSAGRVAISNLVHKSVDAEVAKSIYFVSALKLTPELIPQEKDVCNKIFELSSEIPTYLKEGKSLGGDKSARKSTSEMGKPESWGELVELVLQAKREKRADIVQFLVEKLGPEKVEELLRCKI